MDAKAVARPAKRRPQVVGSPFTAIGSTGTAVEKQAAVSMADEVACIPASSTVTMDTSTRASPDHALSETPVPMSDFDRKTSTLKQ